MDAERNQQASRGDIGRFIAKVSQERDLDLKQYRLPYVERRILARLSALRLTTYRQYAGYLDEHPDEYSRLLNTLTINVTDFFRDPSVYEAFREKVVKELIERKLRSRHRMLRVWSAGCATGEEAYSLAMSFLAEMDDRSADFILSVTGTDLDEKALAAAERAEYDLRALRRIAKADRARFLDIGVSSFKVRPEVTACVRFKSSNLFKDEPIRLVDVIFCRNVFIYFTRPQQARILDIFLHSLNHRGYLVLGRSEKMALSVADSFEIVDARNRIYRKK